MKTRKHTEKQTDRHDEADSRFVRTSLRTSSPSAAGYFSLSSPGGGKAT
jgi:hypothetical protein